jgi:hypothetical protein
MPVAYYVRENKLTTPPSYSCQTSAEDTLGYDEIAELIHTLNPSITAAQAKTVLQNFQQVVTEQVADGKFVKLENFVSFMPKGRTTSWPAASVNICGNGWRRSTIMAASGSG